MDYTKRNTPYFLIHTEAVDELTHTFQKSLKSFWPNGIIGYSIKTNNLPWMIHHMKEQGLWAEVVSSDEYSLALELRYSHDHIIFNGPVKGKEEFIEAIRNNSIVNIDSKRELEWLTECDSLSTNPYTIGLRVNFCVEEYCPGETKFGSEDGRFGFSYETGELADAINLLKSKNICISGLHMHCSSKSRSLKIYETITKMAIKIAKEYALSLKYIDIGGGFFGGVAGKPSFKQYFETVYNTLKSDSSMYDCNIIAEPGVSIVGSGVDYITTVVDVKKTKNNTFVLLDGSRIHIDPLMKKESYLYLIVRNTSQNVSTVVEEQILCGFTCMEGDRFFRINDVPLTKGDIIVFQKMGAYTMGLSPQFIEFFPAVYEAKGDEFLTAREKGNAKTFVHT